MKEGKRQKQVAALLNHELNDIFHRRGLNMMDGGMISISSVAVTPDLLEARVYLSLFQVKNAAETMKHIEDRHREIKRELGERVGKQLRRMPVLQFFHDDTLEHAFKIEEILKQIKKDDLPGS